MAQLMPLPLTVSCFSKIQIGFTFLVPAHLGSPGKGPLNGCVIADNCMSFVQAAQNSLLKFHYHEALDVCTALVSRTSRARQKCQIKGCEYQYYQLQ